MTSFEFFELLWSNITLYLLALLISGVIFYKIANRISSSWFNPLKINVLTAGIGFSVFLFLFFTKSIFLETFVYILVSTLIFWYLFILLYRNKSRQIFFHFSHEAYFAKNLFFILYLLNIFLTLLSYQLLGIPIFNEDSRLATYVNSGGLGVIERLSSVMTVYLLFFIVHSLNESKSKITIFYYMLLLFPILIFGVLSGSRSSFKIVLFAFWGYKTFYVGREPQVSRYKKMFVPFLIISVLTFFIQSSGDLYIALISFGERVVACGDLYWQALPQDAWEQVNIESPVRYIFMSLFGPLRIWDANLAEIPIGFQLTSITYPQIAGVSTGPVALFPVSSLVFYGYYGGLLFTCLQAVLAAVLFRYMYVRSNSFIFCAIYFYIFNELIPFIGDISAAFGSVFNILLNVVFIAFILLLIALWRYIMNVK